MDEFNTFEIIKKKLSRYMEQQRDNDYLSEHGKWLVARIIEECMKIVDITEAEKEQCDMALKK